MIAPPTNSASANCQPISTPEHDPELDDEVRRGEHEDHRADEVRSLWKSDFAIAAAAYEHEDDTNPVALPRANLARPGPSRRSICRAVTNA